MVTSQSLSSLSSLSCELRIIRAKNVELKREGNLFVRYYLSAGNNKRIQLNSREMSSNFDLFWNEFFSLECFGNEDSIQSLKQQSVVLELRCRNTGLVLGRLGGSHLLGRAEIPWKTVFESPEMEIEQWVTMVSRSSRVVEGGKPPGVQVRMKVRVPATVETEKRRKYGRLMKWDECGCKDDGCNCAHDDIFALAVALEAL